LPSAAYRLLRKAVTEHFCLRCVYGGKLRRFCPYALGYDSHQAESVFVLQYGGESSQPLASKGNDWRCLKVMKIAELKRDDHAWVVEHSPHSRSNTCIAELDVEVGTWRPSDDKREFPPGEGREAA
jgi:hypothetical protein